MNENIINSANNTLASANDCFNSLCTLSDGIADISKSWTDLEREIHAMDLQFNAYMRNLEVDLEKYKISAPIVCKQLDKLQDKMGAVMDKVVDMDVTNELEFKTKSRMMDSVDKYIDSLASMMIKLL